MSNKIWMLTPALALAVAGGLAFLPARQDVAAVTPPCVKLASDDGIMTDAAPDACVFSVEKVVKAGETCAKSHAASAIAPGRTVKLVRVREGRFEEAPRTLNWPGDVIELTTDAATLVWDETIGFIGDLYDFAEEKAQALWI